MMKKLAVIAALISFAIPSFAQDKSAKEKPITVREAINIGSAISELSKRDKDGKPIYRFPADIIMANANNSLQSDMAQKAWQETIKNIVAQVYGSQKVASELQAKMLAANVQNENAKKDPKILFVEVPVDPKASEFQSQLEKAADTPAGVLMTKIKRDDLCLKVKEPECPSANPITGDLMKLLLPIIVDR